jgi:hypothetical protein
LRPGNIDASDSHAKVEITANQYLPFRKSMGNRSNGISDILGRSYQMRSRIESDGVSQLHENLQRFICALLTRLAAAVPWRQPLSAHVNSRRGEPHKTPVTW